MEWAKGRIGLIGDDEFVERRLIFFINNFFLLQENYFKFPEQEENRKRPGREKRI